MAFSAGSASAHRTGSWPALPDRTGLAVVLAGVSFALIGVPAGINPVAVIGGAAGAVFVALVLSDVTVGLMCFGLVAFFENLPGLGSSVSAAKLAGTLVALSWLATIAIRPNVRRGFFAAHPVATYASLLLISWMVVSLTWAKDPSAGITSISRYGLNLLLLPIVFVAIRTRRHVYWLVATLVGGATLAALYGMVFARGSALAEGTSRLSGAGADANYLAAFLVAGVVLAAGVATIASIPSGARVLAVGAAALGLVALLDTVSRGGLVGLLGALVVGIVFAGRGRRGILLALAITASLSIVAYYVSVASPATRARITNLNSGSGRVDIWTVGWRIVRAHPVQGIGVGNFSNSTVDYLLEPGIVASSTFIVDEPKVAHNIYLEILAELGIVGLVLFLGLVGFLLSCGVRAARVFRRTGDGPMEVIARAVVVATAGILVTDFFISDQFSKPLWLQLALCPSLLALAMRSRQDRLAD